MTRTAPALQVLAVGGRLTATCALCGASLVQVPGVHVAAARAALEAAHGVGTRHPQRPPAGWRACLSWPGALSQ